MVITENCCFLGNLKNISEDLQKKIVDAVENAGIETELIDGEWRVKDFQRVNDARRIHIDTTHNYYHEK